VQHRLRENDEEHATSGLTNTSSYY